MADNALNTDDMSDEPTGPTVPSHRSLPPPPELKFSRPVLPGDKSVFGERQLRSKVDTSSNMPGQLSVGAGLAGGLTFGSSILAGALIGMWIDSHWKHAGAPWGSIIMTLLGCVVGFVNMLRLISRSSNK